MITPRFDLTRTLCLLLSAQFLFVSCNSVQTLDRTLYDSSTRTTLNNKSPFLKAHMREGGVYILSHWKVDSSEVVGWGDLLDFNRTLVARRDFTLPLDSVVLFETNVLDQSGSVTALQFLTVLSGAMTIYCAANPKACFGSCPTFYVSDGCNEVLQAEGFSASVLPSLEERDIDALFRARPVDGKLDVHMKNEAFETHVIRYVNILACPRSEDARVFATPGGEFWVSHDVVFPRQCLGPEGDFGSLVQAMDGQERFSAADPTDLAARETLYVDFPSGVQGRHGLVVASRQSLVSTYLFYQGLAYMGTSAGTLLAGMERGDPVMRNAYGGMKRALGGIMVDVLQEEGSWVEAGEILEFGPLASDIRLLPLPDGSRRVRLRCAKGSWRIDWLVLARMDQPVDPIRLNPTKTLRLTNDGEWAGAEENLKPLVTVRGDERKFSFELPDKHATYEFFLESRGYYLEWMREEWLAEENPERAALMLFDPSSSLKLLAPEFKKQEAAMESEFWRSGYAR